MKIIIITDDSSVKFPPFNKWKNKFGRGTDISKNLDIISVLNEENSSVPTDDIYKEFFYQKILEPFIRPARFMFSGNFLEVAQFADTLSKLLPTEIFIVSGRYGLINEKSKIIPYQLHIDTTEKLIELDQRTKLLSNIQKLLQKDVICLVLLPKHYIQFLLKNKIFQHNLSENLIVVSLGEFEESLKKSENIIFLNRPGVARIGKQNREKIIEFIDRKLSENNNSLI